MSKKQSPKSFWARVNKKAPNGCWEWTGSINNTGYGSVSWCGAVYTAHRIAAWISGMVEHMEAPEHSRMKTHVLHKCDNRRCCNPDHLFLGSLSDNMYDMYEKNRKVQPKGEKHTNSKLTNKEATMIRKQYNKGEKQTSLASKYGVSQTAISLVVRGVTY
jgi:hypothetical protein